MKLIQKCNLNDEELFRKQYFYIVEEHYRKAMSNKNLN